MTNNKENHTVKIIGKIYDEMIKAVNEQENVKPKNIILYIGKIHDPIVVSIREYCKETKKDWRIAVLHDSKVKLTEKEQAVLAKVDIQLTCDLNSPSAIQKTLLPYQSEILVITCRAEDKIPSFAKVVPHVPYVNAPTSESLQWASSKIMMRKRLFNHNKDITVPFAVIKDASPESLQKIENNVGFPLIVKPSALAASRLVSICFHKEELEEVLKKTFKKIESVYKELAFMGEQEVLVEKYMEGEMYSIDCYVNRKGVAYFCPPVHVKTGKNIGFDDFFGYQQMTPTALKKESITNMEFVAQEAVHALALRSTTAHIEFFKTEEGWKIIELGARVGGFRHMMYEYSYGINHTINDILIRLPEKPIIPKKIKGYTVAMKFFAKEEGTMTKLTGVKKIQELESFKEITVNKNVGDQCKYAKNGGSSVFNLIMFNTEKAKLLADIRRVEQMVEIETTK